MISIVVPIFNEQENLAELRRRVAAALNSATDDWELILVDDGSTDGSADTIRRFHDQDPRIKLLRLSRNFGHQPAVTAGINHARGDCVILLDGDLQDPPEVIPQMIERWKQGYQVVLAERASRADDGSRGLGMRLFYPLMRRMSDLPDGPDAGIFCLMDRIVADELRRLPERNRFIPGLRSWLGFRQTSVTYDRQHRAAGRPKQSLSRLFHYALDAILSFSYKPLRWVTGFGFIVSGVSFLLAVYYIGEFIYRRGQTYGTGFTTLIVCLLLLAGVQLIAIGILGQYIGRIYDEVKQRPLYVVQERIGLANDGVRDGPDH